MMTHPRARPRQRHALLILLLAVLLGACSQVGAPTPPPATSTVIATPPAPPPATGTAVATPTAVGSSTPTPRPTPTTPPRPGTPTIARQIPRRPLPTAAPPSRLGAPVRVQIPAIGVDAAVEEVGLTPDGAMDVPKAYANTAWYTLGPRPGEPGNAVIAGHVDSQTGPAVFWELRQLAPGDAIIVVGDDAVERTFVVTAVEVYPRTEAPLRRIFGPTPGAHLNLITCDGVFDQQRREYDKNLVVYADYAP